MGGRFSGESQRNVADGNGNTGDSNGPRLEVRKGERQNHGTQQSTIIRTDWWESEPDVGRVVDGVANRVERLKALGNGQVPLCAAEAWRILISGL